MNKKIRIGTALFMVIVAIVASSAFTYYGLLQKINSSGATLTQKEELVSKLLKANNIVLDKYIGETDNEKLVDGILEGYVASLDDKYSAYLNKENYRAATQDKNAEFEGIGVKVELDNTVGGWRISYVMKGSPAEESEIRIGDVIVAVEGENVVDIGYYVAFDRLGGKAGSKAKFTVLRGEETKDFEIERKSFTTSSVEEYKMLSDNIAFIRILEFDASTPNEFKTQLDKAISDGAKSVVFDLRNNPGGTLTSIVSILEGLLPEGNIVTLKYKEEILEEESNRESVVYTCDGKNELSIPAAVLVNGNTASAAELFTAALRDYQKAVIVGETTYGKGVGQETISLGDETAIRLTTFSYLPPSGVSYDGLGIKPNYEVMIEDMSSNAIYGLSEEDDTQLQKALEVLKQ